MERCNVLEERFIKVRVLDKPALFHDLRLDRDTVPEGMYLYEVRHDDEGLGEIVQIARGILVNHFGSLLMTEPIELPSSGYLDIDEEKDWEWLDETSCTVKEFMKEQLAMKEN